MAFKHKTIPATQLESVGIRAFEVLVKEHHKRLLAYAFSLVEDHVDAEDLVQDTFVTAYRKLSSFDSSRDFCAWARGILRNKYYQLMEKRKKAGEVNRDLELVHQTWDAAAERGQDVFVALQDCLDVLPVEYEKPVKGFYLDRSSCQTIAQYLKLSQVSVRKRLERGRHWLAGCISEKLKQFS